MSGSKQSLLWLEPDVRQLIEDLGEDLGIQRGQGANKSQVVTTAVRELDRSIRMARARGEALDKANDEEARSIVRAAMKLESGDRAAVRALFDRDQAAWDAFIDRIFPNGDLDKEWPRTNGGEG